ncbi:hypothetical protein BSKO_12581 [Bryopsis sp. KO-2023]|nr:hypothetical protein BSKO_12581 [Bryopsis sp. KO-2023]
MVHEDDDSKAVDWNMEFVRFVSAANEGKGLSKKDTISLIKFINHPDFSKEKFDIASFADVANIRDRLLANSGTEWTRHEISVGENDMSFKIELRDPKSWLIQEFEKGGLVLHAQKQYVDGVRIYSDPSNSDAWIQSQELPERVQVNGTIASIQIYSDKTVINRKGVSAYPMKAVLLNLPIEERRRRISIIGYIPIMKDVRELSSAALRQVRLELHSKCWQAWLDPLKKLSFDGFELEDKIIFPVVHSVVADDPECHDFTCIYNWACEQCHVKERNDIEVRASLRTQAEQIQRYEEIQCAENGGEKIALAKQYATHPVVCSLWGFRDSTLETSDPYTIVGYDILHVDDLGLFLYLVDCIPDYFKKYGDRRGLVKELNGRLKAMPISENFPNPCAGFYVGGHTGVQAKEHRTIIQTMPHCIDGLCTHNNNELMELFALYNVVYQKKRGKAFSSSDLDDFDDDLMMLHRRMLEVIGEFIPSGLSTNKFHKHQHIVTHIRRIGCLEHLSSDFFETDHKIVKRDYLATSKKSGTFLNEMIKRRRLSEVLDTPGVVGESRTYATAFMRAFSTSQHELSISQHKFWLRPSEESWDHGRSLPSPQVLQFSRALLEAQPELDKLLLILQRFFDVPLPDFCSISKHMVLAVQTESGDFPLQTCRATAQFHGRPRFDDVVINANDGSEWIGQLRCLLAIEVGGEKTELALVKWYDDVHGDELKEFGGYNGIIEKYGGRAIEFTRGGDDFLYDIVHILSIKRRCYVVPAFNIKEKEVFYCSPFKWG